MGGAILLFFALILTIDSVVGQDCMKPGRWVSYSDSKATSPDSSYQVIQTDDGLIAVPSIQVTWNSGVITCSDNVYLVAGNLPKIQNSPKKLQNSNFSISII